MAQPFGIILTRHVSSEKKEVNKWNLEQEHMLACSMFL